MSCEEVRPRLSELLDGSLSPAEQAVVRVHLDECAVCRGVYADLERVRAAARDLGPIAPPAHLWLEVAGRVRLETDAAPAVAAAGAPDVRRARLQWLGIAAALVLATLTAYVMRGPSQPPPAATEAPAATTAAGNPRDTRSVEAVAEEMRLALQHYENAISGLEAITRDSNSAMDPEVAATVQRNLMVINQAISESRAALVDDPTSGPARESLVDALRRKMDVLTASVSLINQMRQGDQIGAARATGRKSS
ncbi:MAG TPA: zf-HC2 domain-containing protein [Vicinamibacterales bacterium]|nr:zf-HC2 domain-containing protein [Vicinamibacterales bacterium]